MIVKVLYIQESSISNIGAKRKGDLLITTYVSASHFIHWIIVVMEEKLFEAVCAGSVVT